MGVPVKPTYVALGNASRRYLAKPYVIFAPILSASPSVWMDSLEPILFWERCASSLRQMTLERSVSNPVVSANF